MVDTLTLTGAIGGAVAAVTGLVTVPTLWRGELVARLQLRAEQQRTDQARIVEELHRRRFAEVWQAWHERPMNTPEGVALARWYGEWTGAREPLHGDEIGAMPPGVGSAGADDAYERYVDFLSWRYRTPAASAQAARRKRPGLPWRRAARQRGSQPAGAVVTSHPMAQGHPGAP